MRKVPFLDLKINNAAEKKNLLHALEKVLDHGQFILGPEVAEFEKKFASYCGKKYGIGVNSGTDALFILLKGFGIGPGDEVITTSLSCIATANAIAMTGAKPVFADICDDLNIDPESIKKRITTKTKAILPVHYCGRVCDMSSIMNIAKEHNLLVIEDAAQAVGSTFKEKPAGSFGDYACFSLNPVKVFAALGEAGVILTDSLKLSDRLKSLRYNGMIEKETCVESSLNGKIDTIQAAILLERMPKIGEIIEKRRALAAIYSEKLNDIVSIPIEREYEYNNYYTYIIQLDRRDELMSFLSKNGVETKIYYPLLMSQQAPYKHFSYEKPKNGERLVKRILSLPCHEKMTKNDVEYVCSIVLRFF